MATVQIVSARFQTSPKAPVARITQARLQTSPAGGSAAHVRITSASLLTTAGAAVAKARITSASFQVDGTNTIDTWVLNSLGQWRPVVEKLRLKGGQWVA